MKILPYNTQILSILGLLSGDKKHLKGRIAQIRTGEGKSTIIAILSAYMALQGHFVDIITSSQYLARRDQEKYLGFYKMLGITSSHICENQPKK
jgi:preprotein translocase subunit SecA